MMMWWDSPLFGAKAVSNLLVGWSLPCPGGETPQWVKQCKRAGPQPGHLHLHWQTTPPLPALDCCTTIGGSPSLPGAPSPISLCAKWRGWSQWLLWWLLSCVNVARPWCPGMWPNIILDVYVRVFWVRLTFISVDFDRKQTNGYQGRRGVQNGLGRDWDWHIHTIMYKTGFPR